MAIVVRRYYTENLLARAVDVFVAVIEIALGLRFVLKLLGANPSAGFVDWVYATTAPLLEPFAGMFPSPVLERGFILEFSTLFAMLAYAVLGWLIVELVYLVANSVRGVRG
jgi:hypothetical protein